MKEKGDGENCKRQEDKMNNRLTGEGERERWGRGMKGRRREKNENAPGMILMLHLVFTFQADKSCNIQPQNSDRLNSSSSWETGSTGLLLYPSLSVPFPLVCCKRETIWRRSAAQQRRVRGLGGRARGDDEVVEGGLGCKV